MTHGGQYTHTLRCCAFEITHVSKICRAQSDKAAMKRAATIANMVRPSRALRMHTTSAPSTVSIGGVSVSLEKPQFQELVPTGFKMSGGDSQQTLEHLR